MPTCLVGSRTIHTRQSLFSVLLLLLVAPARHVGSTLVTDQDQYTAIPTTCGTIQSGGVTIVIVIVRLLTDETVSHDAIAGVV
eukprot:scaffold4929_cov176-Amphora_coffeaeformis.AAC.14